MAASGQDVLASGFKVLVGAQLATRLLTFGLNIVGTRFLTVEGYGLSSVQFHLINTGILFLTREGIRRGFQRAQQAGSGDLGPASLLLIASVVMALGTTVTGVVCVLALRRRKQQDRKQFGYKRAILLQGQAALLELLSEPLWLLAKLRFRFLLQARIETFAAVTRVLVTLLLLWSGVLHEAVALSIAQVVYAVLVLGCYVASFLPEVTGWLLGRAPQGPTMQPFDIGTWGFCLFYTLQAFIHFFLAEGSKLVMAAKQSAFDQGIYGLVANLGSLVVRILLQPINELAFQAFSQPDSLNEGPLQRLQMLAFLVRVIIIIGLVVVAFGPSNSYLLLRVVYGERWSATKAPAALAVYCPYLLLLAASGILETFVQAVAVGWELSYSTWALVILTGVHLALSLKMVRWRGSIGLILADAANMALRVGYSLAFVSRYAARLPSHAASFSPIMAMLPSHETLGTLVSGALVSALSAAFVLGRGPLAGFVERRIRGFWSGAALHVLLEIIVLAGVMVGIQRAEPDMLAELRLFWRQRKQA